MNYRLKTDKDTYNECLVKHQNGDRISLNDVRGLYSNPLRSLFIDNRYEANLFLNLLFKLLGDKDLKKIKKSKRINHNFRYFIDSKYITKQ